MELQVGSILEGKVTSITKFGAFVALDNGKSGLVHISEIANTFVNDVHDYLQEGQAVQGPGALHGEWKGQSLHQADAPQAGAARPQSPAQRQPPGRGRPVPWPRPGPAARGAAAAAPLRDQSFEDKLKQFLSSSEGKMADLNRSLDGRRGGGRRRR